MNLMYEPLDIKKSSLYFAQSVSSIEIEIFWIRNQLLACEVMCCPIIELDYYIAVLSIITGFNSEELYEYSCWAWRGYLNQLGNEEL